MAPKRSAVSKIVPVEIEDFEDETHGDFIVARPVRPRSYAENRIISTHYETLPSGRLGSRSEILEVEGLEVESGPQPDDGALNDSFVGWDNDNWSENDDYVDLPQTHTVQVGKRQRLYEPLKEWVNERETFLSEFLRLEGQDETRPYCAECKTSVGCYRCLDCDGLDVLCHDCILEGHRRNGLHRIEEWDFTLRFFKKTTLRSLGHIFQMGHPLGERCHVPSRPYAGDFTVVDINGVHKVSLLYCGCQSKQQLYIQLLRFGWFSATVKFPRMAFTLRALKFFHILSFEAKTTVYEFSNTLRRITDNTGTMHVKDHYRTMLRIIREYRHIKMLKRSGRGHDRTGAIGTKAGECAVLCPACPHFGRNVKVKWEDIPKEKMFLYCLFIGLDANFRLKRRMISSTAADPSLSKGWSYFVPDDAYKEFLEEFGTLIIQEPSTCSNHDAVNKERGAEGFAASGVGTCDCIRHDMKRACSVGDTQKGERYVNMDYLFFSSIKDTDLMEVVVSYDIACQWGVNLWERMKLYPQWMHTDYENKTTYRFLVPKFHLPAHVKPCQTNFSFNYNPKVGRTDGEGVERGWNGSNPLATSTREMTSGSRRDTLDDHFGDWNWTKTTKLAKLMLSRFETAVPKAYEHKTLHEEFTDGLRAPETVQKWTMELSAWEEDHTCANPFEPTFKAMSLDAVRKQLAEEEAKLVGTPLALDVHEHVSASQLITMGMELEIEQYRMDMDKKKQTAHTTDNQEANWTLRSNTLRRKINSWIDIQHMYIPLLRQHRQKIVDKLPDSHIETPVYSISLFLPSSLPPNIPCDIRLVHIEFKLRYAQCTDALDELRNSLCLRSYLFIDKSRFQRGQHANTRSQGIINRVQAKVTSSASKYRNARVAVGSLCRKLGKVGWEQHILELKPEDIRALNDEESLREKNAKKKRKENVPSAAESDQEFNADAVVSEGHRTVSWIWRQMGGEAEMDNETRLHESLRIEWCKSKCRADRWREELELLQEERRRILLFFEERAADWERLEARSRIIADPEAEDGRVWMLPGVRYDPVAVNGREAYAREQAHQYKLMVSHFKWVWRHIDPYIVSNGATSVRPLEGAEDDDDDSNGDG